jgi:hypothetical protein
MSHVALQRRVGNPPLCSGARVKIKIEKKFARALRCHGVDKDRIEDGNLVASGVPVSAMRGSPHRPWMSCRPNESPILKAVILNLFQDPFLVLSRSVVTQANRIAWLGSTELGARHDGS